MSVMEMSHRSKPYEAIIAEAEADFRALFGVPDGYKVLFLQGGASTQFATIPMSFLGAGQSADYLITGAWGKKALESAKLVGNARVVWDGKAENYNDTPSFSELDLDANAAYVHFTTNETIQGVQFKADPSVAAPLVCDMSSDILSRPVDVSKYAMIYAGAQKNMGPAGVAVIVIGDELLAKGATGLQPMFDYRVHAENGSMYNTPPCWSIYMCGLVYKHMLANGGLTQAQALCNAKSNALYAAIDASGGFYRGHAKPHCRSTMNVTFNLPNDDLAKAFIRETEAAGFDGLKGHRSVGGIRASIYNAFPLEGCEALAAFMADFAKRTG